jgi:hypothetical protein
LIGREITPVLERSHSLRKGGVRRTDQLFADALDERQHEVDITSCLGWPAKVTNPQHKLSINTPAPVLIAASKYDVGTPHAWSARPAHIARPSGRVRTRRPTTGARPNPSTRRSRTAGHTPIHALSGGVRQVCQSSRRSACTRGLVLDGREQKRSLWAITSVLAWSCMAGGSKRAYL